MKELMTALVAAQAEMENARKDSKNPFFKSTYADLSSVMGAIKPTLAKYSLGFVQICHDAPECAKVETVIIHSSGETFSCGTVSVPVSKADAQGYGSAITYARRYSLSAAFGVGTEDDDGNAASKSPPRAFTSSHSPSDGATAKLDKDEQEYLKELAVDLVEIDKNEGIDSSYKRYESENLDPEQKVALWEILRPHSTLRTGLNKIAKLKKEASNEL